MIFRETSIPGVQVLELEPYVDRRGFFARTFCTKEFVEHGMTSHFVQANLSHNKHRGTLRGLHLQLIPYQEAKLIRCINGAIFDVVVDLRAGSKTHCRWFSVELSAANGRALYIPEGCAHGFQTVRENTDVIYMVSAFHTPESERGYRFDDPVFAIDWPLPVNEISDKDASWPHYTSPQTNSA